MYKLQEVVHKFRSGTGGSQGGDGKKEAAGGMDDGAHPSASAASGSSSSSLPSSRTSSTASTAEQTRGERRGDTVWYVDHHFTAEPPKVEKGELSSLSLLTAAGLQHTVLAVLRQTDPTTTAAASSTTTTATTTGVGDGMDAASKGAPTSPEKRLGKTQPKGTLEYKVKASDTLERIAAHHDITPSELQKLNRMTSRMVFAGQALYIPDPAYVPSDPPTPEPSSPPVSPTIDTRPKLDVPLVKMADKPPERVPGHVMKIPSPPSSASILQSPHPLSEDEARRLDEECYERFIKVCTKYISDGMGMVSGTLLVTPNAIMFDPNVLDPLVDENGAEAYGVVVYMDTILSAALYHDLSAMRYHTRSSSEREVSERPSIYHADLRPRSASTSSIMTNSSATVATQGVTTSHSTSGLSPFFAASAEGGQMASSDQNESEAAALFDMAGESSTDVEMVAAGSDQGREAGEEITVVAGDVAGDMHQGAAVVELEGAVSGETSTDGVFAADGDMDDGVHTAPSPPPHITFDLSSLSLESGDKGIPESSDIAEGEDITAGPPSWAGIQEKVLGEAAPTSMADSSSADLAEVNLLSFDSPVLDHPDNGKSAEAEDVTEQDGMTGFRGAATAFTGETTTDKGDNLVSLAVESGPPEKLNVPIQESAGVLAFADEGRDAVEHMEEDRSAEACERVSASALENTDAPLQQDESKREMAGPVEGTRVEVESESGAAMEEPGAAGEELRIGSIVYLPVQESSSGEMVVRDNSNDLALAGPAQTDSNIAGDDGAVRDSLDGASPGSGGQSRPASGSFSPLRSSAQHLSNFVNYATGLFRSTTDDRKDVQDTPQSQGLASVRSEGGKKRWASAPGWRGKVPSGQTGQHTKNAVSAVRADERPDLFQDIHNLITHLPDDDHQPPIYLHLHVDEIQCDRQVSHSAPLESYRQHQTTKPHYWFSIPRSKADNLYAFFVQWRPELYGDDDDINPEDQGFVVIEDAEVQQEDAKLDIVEEYFGPTAASFKKDWELVSREEARRRQPSVDTEPVVMPEMTHESSILSPQHVLKLSDNLPPRTIGYCWSLVYSTAMHGFSLKRLYRDVGRIDSPILLVVQDTAGIVFGAYISHPPRFSDHFYGNGTSQLWTFKDGFRVFTWTGDNTFFIKGNEDSLCVGAGAGQFGLWLDGDLYHGRSHRCETFANCVLSSQEDFFIKAMEAWAFE